VYRHFATVAAEFFDMPYITKENIDKWGYVEGLEHYDSGYRQRQGRSVHRCSFRELGDIAGRHSHIRQTDSYCIPGRWYNPVIDNMVEYVRTKAGNELIPKGGSGKGLWTCSRRIRLSES